MLTDENREAFNTHTLASADAASFKFEGAKAAMRSRIEAAESEAEEINLLLSAVDDGEGDRPRCK